MPHQPHVAAANVTLAQETGAAGHGRIVRGDATNRAAALPAELSGQVVLVLTSPPRRTVLSATGPADRTGTGFGGRCGTAVSHHGGSGPCVPRGRRRRLPLHDGLTTVLGGCVRLLRPGGADQPTRHQGANGFTPRLAALFVGAYTRAGDTILGLSCDPTIEGAAGAGARRYLLVNDRTDLNDIGRPRGSVGLIVLRWPTHTDRLTHAMAIDLFTVCRSLLTRDGHTVVVLALPPGGGPYIEHAQVLISAARQARLHYLQHIVAVTAPIAGEHRTIQAAPGNAAIRLTAHMDLLVFELRGDQHA